MAVIGVRQESCREQRQIGGRSWRRGRQKRKSDLGDHRDISQQWSLAMEILLFNIQWGVQLFLRQTFRWSFLPGIAGSIATFP